MTPRPASWIDHNLFITCTDTCGMSCSFTIMQETFFGFMVCIFGDMVGRARQNSNSPPNYHSRERSWEVCQTTHDESPSCNAVL